jgi:hypothetical protein
MVIVLVAAVAVVAVAVVSVAVGAGIRGMDDLLRVVLRPVVGERGGHSLNL